MVRHVAIVLAFIAALALSATAQDSNAQDQHLDIRSNFGDLHVGPDADAKKIGVPLYPRARPKVKDEHDDQANISLLTEAFGMKLLVASYVSDDAPAKVIDFYRDKLKKYGKVLECHAAKNVNVGSHDSEREGGKGKELKCDDGSGPGTQ